MRHIEKVKNVFDLWAMCGRADEIEKGHTFSVQKMLEFVKKNQKDPFAFLDIGCGNGWAVRKMIQLPNCYLSCGIDVSTEMIKLANNRKTNEKEHYICGDICNLDLNEKFDIILSMETIYYISSPEHVFKKVYENLNENGFFVFGVDFYAENTESFGWPQMVGVEMQLKSITEWKNILLSSGFKIKSAIQIRDISCEEKWKNSIGTLSILCEKC